MATVKEIAKRSNEFVNNLGVEIAQAIEPVEQQITDLNRSQMLASSGNDDKPLVNTRTGSSLLSPQYARRTGKRKPDIFLKGVFQSEMFTRINENTREYFITSNDRKIRFLPKMFKNLFGIARSNRNKAYAITTPAIAKRYIDKLRG